MAGDWMACEITLPDKPEVWQMAGELGVSRNEVIGGLIRVWGWFDTHTEDGITKVTQLALLDCESGVSGFGQAMISSGWLELNEHGMCMPNFEFHNGKSAKKRLLTARRQKTFKDLHDSNAKGNADGVTGALPQKRTEQKSTVKKRTKQHTINQGQGQEHTYDGDTKTTKKAKPATYPEDFERIWSKRPGRSGDSKKAAHKAFNARLKQGVPIAELEAGLERYAKYIQSSGSAGTSFVKLTATFFGPNEHYLELWETPKRKSRAVDNSGLVDAVLALQEKENQPHDPMIIEGEIDNERE